MKKTKIQIPEHNIKIELQDNIFSIGSCFSGEIADFLKKNGLFILSNPFGTIYNSFSLLKIFEIFFDKKHFDKSDLFFENNKYFSLFHSTEFDGNSLDESFNKIINNIKKVKQFIKNTNVFIITVGTSVVYLYKKTNFITANCHKLPDNLFEKKILSVDENVLNLRKIIDLIKENNKNAKIIFTLSPVRHTPNNLIENQFSKSVLRNALESIRKIENVIYFPSYEIILDELRDYKYYKNDGMHLKKNTIKKIMGRFKDSFFDIKINKFIEDFNYCKRIRKHKTKDKRSIEYYELLKKVLLKLSDLCKINKTIFIEKEIFIICKKLIKNFYDKNEIEDFINVQLNDIDELKNLFFTFYRIYNNEYNEINEDDFSYENEYIKHLKKYKSKLKATFYYNKNDYKKSADILLSIK